MGPFPSMSICPTAIWYEVQHWKGIFVSKRVPEPLCDPLSATLLTYICIDIEQNSHILSFMLLSVHGSENIPISMA